MCAVEYKEFVRALRSKFSSSYGFSDVIIPDTREQLFNKYTHSHTHINSLTHTHTHTHSLSLSHTLAHTHTHTFTHSNAHTLTHSNAHTHSHNLPIHNLSSVCFCVCVCVCVVRFKVFAIGDGSTERTKDIVKRCVHTLN